MEQEYLERTIKFIVIHCTATPASVDFTPEKLEACHRARGFRTTGYHLYITRDGAVHHTRPLGEVGAHAKGFNLHSVGVAYEGGVDEQGRPADTRTPAQREALLDVVTALKRTFPDARVVGHYQLSADIHKACPCFDAEKEFSSIDN